MECAPAQSGIKAPTFRRSVQHPSSEYLRYFYTEEGNRKLSDIQIISYHRRRHDARRQTPSLITIVRTSSITTYVYYL
jgi:histidinol phosphatase-like enzyme